MVSVPLSRVVTFLFLVVVAFALSLGGTLPTAARAQEQAVTVTRVVDGDTIEISPAIGGKEDVRLIGVDTPETVDPNEDVQPYGQEASRFTTRELEGERVRLEFDQEREDLFGRLLAYVRLPDDSLFNETLLSRGYAQLYTVAPNDRYEARFERAQQRAREAELGIWGLSKDQQCELADLGNGIGEGSPGCADAPNASADKDCADFSSQAAAQEELETDTADPNGLDGDSDGQACEDFDYAGGGTGGPTDDQYGADGKGDIVADTVPDEPLPKTGGFPMVPLAALLAAAAGVVGTRIVRRS